MSFCDCKICTPDDKPVNKPVPIYHVVVKKMKSGYWAVQAGSVWIEIRGSNGLTLDQVRSSIFTDLDDVRAHPNSVHFDEGRHGS